MYATIVLMKNMSKEQFATLLGIGLIAFISALLTAWIAGFPWYTALIVASLFVSAVIVPLQVTGRW
jgi:hypothetical protein